MFAGEVVIDFADPAAAAEQPCQVLGFALEQVGPAADTGCLCEQAVDLGPDADIVAAGSLIAEALEMGPGHGDPLGLPVDIREDELGPRGIRHAEGDGERQPSAFLGGIQGPGLPGAGSMDEEPVALLLRHPQVSVDRGGEPVRLRLQAGRLGRGTAEFRGHGGGSPVGAHINAIGAQNHRLVRLRVIQGIAAVPVRFERRLGESGNSVADEIRPFEEPVVRVEISRHPSRRYAVTILSTHEQHPGSRAPEGAQSHSSRND